MSATDKTKYYWLKLNKDFFQKHQIRVIEGMKNGKEYVLFYLKIMVEATSWEGELRFSKTIPYNEEMLANLTNTPIDTVHTAMEIFKELHLVEVWDDGTLYIEEVKRITGSETGKAIRSREYRERLKGGSNEPAEGSEQAQTSQEIRDKRLEYRDKSIEVTSTNVSVTKIKLDKTRYKQSSLCEILVESGFISKNDLEDPSWDNLLNSFVEEHGYLDTKIKLKYFLSVTCDLRIVGEDKEGRPIFKHRYEETNAIADKFSYMAASMESSFRRLSSEGSDDDEHF